MKVMAQSAQVQAADMQQALQAQQVLRLAHMDAVRAIEALKREAVTPPVAAAAAGQKLNTRV